MPFRTALRAPLAAATTALRAVVRRRSAPLNSAYGPTYHRAAEPLEPRRLLSVAIVEPYEQAAGGNQAAFFADFTTESPVTQAHVSWGDGVVEDSAASDMLDFLPDPTGVGGRGTLYGIHEYAYSGRYAVTFTVKGNDGTTDSSTFFADVSAPAPAQEPARETSVGDGLSASGESASSDSGSFMADSGTESVWWGGVHVTQVFVHGPSLYDCVTGTTSRGELAFRSAAGVDLAFGYAVPGGTTQTTPLSWNCGITSVSIRFSADVAAALSQADLVITGSAGAVPTTGFTYDAATRTGTWTFAAVTRDKLRFVLDDAGVPTLDGEWLNPTEAFPGVGGDAYPSGDGTAGGDFNFRVNVLHGDVSGDGQVNATDVAEIKRRLTRRAGDGAYPDLLRMYTIFSDVNGDGIISGIDLAQVKARLAHTMNGATGPAGAGPIVDLDVDSNNDESLSLSEGEDSVEDNAPGKVLAVNSDDDNDNGLPDNQEPSFDYLDDWGDEMVPMLLDIDISECGCDSGTVSLTVTGNAESVRLWWHDPYAADWKGGYVSSKSWPVDEHPSIVWVEAVAVSADAGDIRIVLTAGGLQDAVRLTAVAVDLDLDSDNSGFFDAPTRSNAEETAEAQRAGKLVVVNRDDSDGDGILDFADGFDSFEDTADDTGTAGEKFAPASVEVRGPTGTLVSFAYSGADPAAPTVGRTAVDKSGLDGVSYTTHDYSVGTGLMRLWRRAGDVGRTSGDYIVPGQAYSFTDLGLPVGGGTVQLFLEAVNGSPTAAQVVMSLMLPGGTSMSDTIRVLPFDPLAGLQETEVTGYRIVRNTTGSLSLEGTTGKDIIIGTAAAEIINGNGGDDIIVPGAGDDTVAGGPGADLMFPYFGSKIVKYDDADEISYIEGNVIGGGRLGNQTTQHQSMPRAEGAAPAAAPIKRSQRFSSEDIVKAYEWAYGKDDIWYQAFVAGGGKVSAVTGDGRPFSYWDVDWFYKEGVGWTGYDVQIQYNIGSVLDAAMALRKAILNKCALYTTPGWNNYFTDIFANPKVDPQTFDNTLHTSEQMKSRQIEYAAAAAELVAELYYESMTVAAGVGGDIVSAVIEFPRLASNAAAVGSKAVEMLRDLPGKVSDWLTEDPVTDGPLIEGEAVGGADPAEGAQVEPASVPSSRVLLKLAGFGEFLAYKDVIRPIIRRSAQVTKTLDVGFVWRKDFLLKLEARTNSSGLNTLILGMAQATGDPRHAKTIQRLAYEMVDTAPANKHYLYIGLNRSLRTLLDTGTGNLRLFNNSWHKHRPDILAVYVDMNDPTLTPKVELREVLSMTQMPDIEKAAVQGKLDAMMNQISGTNAGWITGVKDVLDMDP